MIPSRNSVASLRGGLEMVLHGQARRLLDACRDATPSLQLRIHTAYQALAEICAGAPYPASAPRKRRDPRSVGIYVADSSAIGEIDAEVAMLRRSGLKPVLYVDRADGRNGALPDACRADRRPIGRPGGICCRHPIRTVRSLLYTIGRRHGPYKTLRDDLSTLISAGRLASSLRRDRIAHLHAAGSDQAAFTVSVASAIAGIPYSVRAPSHQLHAQHLSFALRDKIENASLVLTESEYDRRWLLQQTGAAPSSVWTVRSVPAGRKPEPQPQDPPTEAGRLLYCGPLREEAGLVYLLQACRILLDEGRRVQCDIVTPPTAATSRRYQLELKRLARRLDLTDNVRFEVESSSSCLARLREEEGIFVLPSSPGRHGGIETTPPALTAAMALGLATIACDGAGVSELIEDGVTGLLTPSRNSHELARVINRLSGQKELRLRLGRAAASHIESETKQRCKAMILGRKLISGAAPARRPDGTPPATSRPGSPGGLRRGLAQ